MSGSSLKDGLRMSPPPPDMPMTPFAVGGTVLWALAGLVMVLFFKEDLDASGHGWWIDTCWAGVGSGLFGTFWMVLHDRRRPKQAGNAAGNGTAPAEG